MAHVSDKKKKTVAEFTSLLDEYPVVGMVNMANVPAKQLQTMRSKLRDKGTVLKMTKKRLMRIAFKEAKKEGIENLEEHFKGQPALIFTKDNPFKLYAELQKTKSKAPAKAGQTAPKDISVSAGPTSFSPGPIIGQLGKYRIKTGIEGGKIVIKEDAVVIREGEEISQELAGILTRLGIEPMEIGLDLRAAYEDGSIFEAEVLHIDTERYMNNFIVSYQESINLAVSVGFPTPETVPIMLSKAFTDARALAVSQNVVTPETAQIILQKAYGEMLSVASQLPDEALSEALKGSKQQPVAQPKEEPKEDSKEKPKEEPEEKSEEEAAAGLGSLFG